MPSMLRLGGAVGLSVEYLLANGPAPQRPLSRSLNLECPPSNMSGRSEFLPSDFGPWFLASVGWGPWRLVRLVWSPRAVRVPRCRVARVFSPPRLE